MAIKIALVISSLSAGGAERVATNLSGGFADRGDDVTLVTLASSETDFYAVPENVKRIELNCTGVSKGFFNAFRNNMQRIRITRTVLKSIQPDVVISFCTETNVLVLLATRWSKLKVVITEHCDPGRISYGRTWEALRRLIYPLTNKLLSVSAGVASFFTWMPKGKSEVMYNPIVVKPNSEKFEMPAACDLNKRWITSMGRFDPQKGFDILIKAVALLGDKFASWQLIIIGDGKLRSDLEKLIEINNLDDRVVLVGRQSNPHDIIRRSEFFVMASRFEGFPMAHGEALMCGVPVVATDCPSGPAEMIRHQRNGLLVEPENVSKLADTMETLMVDDVARNEMAALSTEIKQHFGTDSIINNWVKVFDAL